MWEICIQAGLGDLEHLATNRTERGVASHRPPEIEE
jgi:hypothetical protein